MPFDLKKVLDKDNPKWNRVRENLKKVETKTWQALDPIGQWSNRTAGKLGAESFWPTELSLEINKAARIIQTFTAQGAQVEVDSSNLAALNDQAYVIPPTLSSSSSSRSQSQGQAGADAKSSTAKGKQKDPYKYDSKKTQKVIKKISPNVLRKAQGLAIFTVFRTGFGLSGAGGSGVVISRLPDGSWSPPSGVLVHTIGWGFLIGADIYDVVLVLRNQKAVDAFNRPKISIGGELSVTAGPVGNGAMLDSGIEASPCWSYVKSKGFYVGAQLDGNFILKRDDENARFYQSRGISVNDILSGNLRGAAAPAACIPLWQTLYAAEGRPQLMGVDPIPQGTAPGDLVFTEQDMKEASIFAGQNQNSQQYGAISSPSAFQPNSSQNQAAYQQPPPAYDFIDAPSNLGAEKKDAHSLSQSAAVASRSEEAPPNPFTGATMASPNETAEQEKERLRRQYEVQDTAATSSSSAPQASSSGVSRPIKVEAMFDFEAKQPEDLAFSKGEIIQVIGQEDNLWWRGQIGQRTGIFPSNYCKRL